MGRHDRDRGSGDGRGDGADRPQRDPRYGPARLHRNRDAVPGAARRGPGEFDARYRATRPAYGPLRLPHADARLGRRRLLPDRRGRRRVAEATGKLAFHRQLAWRPTVTTPRATSTAQLSART